jgi:hypothetical protein
MPARATLWLLPATLLLMPSAVFAQTTQAAAAPEVDQALRARVNEFFQDFVDGKFRQALSLVAEDTQDEYFASPKMEMKGFNIDGITYSDGFTKATVKLTVKQVWRMKAEGFLQDSVVDGPMETTWKIENGKWVWYHQVQTSGNLTPMGPSADIRPAGGQTAPKKINDETMIDEAKRILNQTTTETGVNPKQVTLAKDKASSAKVMFHNGVEGSISLSMAGLPNLPGFSAQLDKRDIGAGQDATVEIRYDPPADPQDLPPSTIIGIEVEPFGEYFPVQVNFGPPK